ncbi:mannose-1-phosphate guanylyltransferase/mannose-6-phosphate isomerase (plasmid) [Salipiger sp. CCB-MM3]|uniref:mannose-1-phosphate guanylyltransferase/mannose-6-phosphate isomerase n=1 Tax=Salipiger sp. CCB-MM3 TaxID=1792508 RepID=UPI00080AB6DE|nr:mannose-1-phosphate guanylyltransferase/mannose-6-phosphate isomerase [Salipiger sp. CCB-MM3]ANT63264.1 mannose-1-phosphate guanylyltransferase/mannose-6-phosphate isomerase [Salipiger sp. CCB-MM3]
MQTITPVILCGGSGTRLWPVSRKSFPKQFARLIDDESLFQATAARFAGSGRFEKPVIVTNSDFRFVVTEQLSAVGIDPGAVLIEPEGRNTAPAVLAAALHLHAKDPDAAMLVAPSDHRMPDGAAFRAALEKGIPAIEKGKFVLFGISPDRPETGYGYLELDSNGGDCVPLKRFVEKPDAETAAKMLAQGNFLWNAGIFLFRVKDILAAFDKFASQLVPPVSAAVRDAEVDLGFLRLAPGPWSEAEDISVDYAVMEKSDALEVVPFDGGWSDLGGWDAIWREMEQDETGVVANKGATAIDCENSILRSDSDAVELVGIGLKDVVAVAMNDAVLVASKDRAQDVKLAVSALKEKGSKQAVEFPMDHRPWGWFESLVVGSRFQVKRIHVHPGAALSLQSHFHRSEHWIVVEGTARVTVDDEVKLVTENESVYIPLGAVHRMENPGKMPMVLIEVQTGSYVGEDDIVRYEDVYSRGQGAKG